MPPELPKRQKTVVSDDDAASAGRLPKFLRLTKTTTKNESATNAPKTFCVAVLANWK